MVKNLFPKTSVILSRQNSFHLSLFIYRFIQIFNKQSRMLTTRTDKCYYDHYLRNKVFIKNTHFRFFVSPR